MEWIHAEFAEDEAVVVVGHRIPWEHNRDYPETEAVNEIYKLRPGEGTAMNLWAILLGVGGSVLFLGWIRRHEQRKRRHFQEQFPPIDDAEFLRRCGSAVDRSIALRVRRIVSEQLCVEYERVYPEHRFVEDLGCD